MRLPLVPLASACLLALVPAAADAATFDVTTAAELTSALATAKTNGQPDKINLAAGTYAGQFVQSNASEDLEIAGTGPDTIIEGTPALSDLLHLTGGGKKHVHDLALSMPAAGANPNSTALEISNGLVEDVTVTAAATVTGNGIHVNGGTVRDVTVTGPDLFRGLYGVGGVASTFERSTVTGASTALDSSSPNTVVTGSRLRLLDANTGVNASFSASVTVRDTLIALSSTTGQTGLLASDSQNSSTHTSTLVGERLTIVGTNPNGNQSGATAQSSSDNDVMAVTVRDSVMTAIGRPLMCHGATGQASVTAQRSNYKDTGSQDNCANGDVLQLDKVSGTPAFADTAAGDYRPAAGSILVDAGDPGLAGNPLDLAGAARPNDGDGDCVAKPDLGAFEHVRTTPVVAISGPATATTGEPVAFTATGSCTTDVGDVMTIAWDFGDGATGTGVEASHTYGAAGDRVVTLTISDQHGHSATKTLNVAVAAPPVDQPNGGTGTGTATGSGSTGTGKTGGTGEAAPAKANAPAPARTSSVPGTGTGGQTQADAQIALRQEPPRVVPGRDRTAPRITKLRVRKRRLTFVLSERAQVVVKLGRRSIRVRGRAGANRVRLRGRGRITVTAVDAAGNIAKKRLKVA